jgi:hypothetical protein
MPHTFQDLMEELWLAKIRLGRTEPRALTDRSLLNNLHTVVLDDEADQLLQTESVAHNHEMRLQQKEEAAAGNNDNSKKKKKATPRRRLTKPTTIECTI